VTVLLPMAGAFATGLLIGWVLTAAYAVAAMSRSQERMQRKVRYWEAQTAYANEKAERLARLIEAHGIRPTPASWEELP
jgi:nucleotide-binding universal stress UspA family protein